MLRKTTAVKADTLPARCTRLPLAVDLGKKLVLVQLGLRFRQSNRPGRTWPVGRAAPDPAAPWSVVTGMAARTEGEARRRHGWGLSR